MLSPAAATKIIHKGVPKGKIQAWVLYKDLYLFQVFTDDAHEEEWDPFFSVNKETGELRDFSVLTDGNAKEVLSLFAKAKGLAVPKEGSE